MTVDATGKISVLNSKHLLLNEYKTLMTWMIFCRMFSLKFIRIYTSLNKVKNLYFGYTKFHGMPLSIIIAVIRDGLNTWMILLSHLYIIIQNSMNQTLIKSWKDL